ncbi:MAG: AMP-binding protein [Muribaculum sp.]|nr:AMP-binding protein [Muribaculaceae bacterium]MCM1080133.1 AMP-binding protein [Muribaculum sp.]
MLLNLIKYGNSTAVIADNGSTLTYSELHDEAQRFASHLSANSLMLNLCNNSVESLAGYIGAINNGVPQVLLDSAKDSETIAQLISIYKADYIWLPRDKSSDFNGKQEYTYGNNILLRLNDKVGAKEMNPQLALCLTTSGSTGSPKFVRLSTANLLSNANSIIEYLNITSKERPVTSLPMHYSYGLSVINSHLIAGATILLTSATVMQREFWNFVKANGATSLSGVPYTYEMLRRLRFNRMDLPSLKTLTQAGGKLSPVLIKEFIEDSQRQGRRFVVMYGQTEATARMSYTPVGKALEKCASIGIPIPGGRFHIVDANDREITIPECDGELVYEGENVSLGYAESVADLAKGDENHGRLHTGDIARFDADGYFYITGRMKRFVKVWGNRCNLDAIEQIAKTIAPVCACVGVDDKITVFITDGIKAEQVKKQLSDKTGFNPRAFEIRVIDSIPMSPAGKTLYAELLKLITQ